MATAIPLALDGGMNGVMSNYCRLLKKKKLKEYIENQG